MLEGFAVGNIGKRKVYKDVLLFIGMFNWLFGSKKVVEELKNDVSNSFEKVKEDINNVSKWLKHFDDKHSVHDTRFFDVEERLSSIENELQEIRNAVSLMDIANFKQLFKTPRRVFNKQTAVQAVQSAVQTAVQTGESVHLSNFSLMERALIMVLLNSDMKLSYDDLAAMTGKSRATVRGQINSIKQKSEGLIEEIIEINGKKRVFIPENIREKMLKNVKVRVSSEVKKRKKARNAEE